MERVEDYMEVLTSVASYMSKTTSATLSETKSTCYVSLCKAVNILNARSTPHPSAKSFCALRMKMAVLESLRDPLIKCHRSSVPVVMSCYNEGQGKDPPSTCDHNRIAFDELWEGLKLTALEAQVLKLEYMGYSQVEIVKKLGSTTGKVKWAVQMTRQKATNYLRRHGG